MSKVAILAFDQIAMFELACAVEIFALPRPEYKDWYKVHHQQNISCSAGSAAALDLGIDIVRQDFGHEIANQVARRLVISPHRHGGQAQYIETPVIKNTGAFSRTFDWAIQHLNQPLSVDDLAQQANMSRRSFDRHFKSALGVSPKAWINQQRINRAKQLLEVEDLSIEQLASKVGYDNGITLRINFNKYVGVAPSQYQYQFKIN